MTKSRNSFSPVNPESVPVVPENAVAVELTPKVPIEVIPDDFSKMPDEWKLRNGYPVDPLPADAVLEDTVNVPEPVVIDRSIAGMPVSDNTQKILDDWDVQRPTDVPLVEASALREVSPSYAKVGYSVLFAGEYAAIITKVWDNGLVNLIIFSAEHPVSDIKTRVPYGEGPYTWKEIN